LSLIIVVMLSDVKSYNLYLYNTTYISKCGQWTGSKREDYQNCSVLYCVLKLCSVISTLRWAVRTVLWIGFCHTGPSSL